MFIIKKNILRFLFLLLLIPSVDSSFAQDSSRIRISLLTCTSGDELYSLFGHSALRVIDSNAVTDIVYNYGTFNFDDPGFYMKFVRGKLLYYVSVASLDEFKYEYEITNRGITEQVLNFSGPEAIKVNHALIENLKEKNKYYQYDFFYDNCTTRLRDIVVNNKHPRPVLPLVRPAGMRFRQAIHEKLDQGNQPWSKLGIDILLGARTDKIMTAAEQQFLPENLMMALDSSTNVKLVSSSRNLFAFSPIPGEKTFFTPVLFFLSVLFFYTVLFFLFRKNVAGVVSFFDWLLYFSTGALGILLIFMWFCTDHIMTKDNYNLIWALPFHFFMSFFAGSKKNWVKKYFLFSFLIHALTLCVWAILPQQLNTALLPFVVLLMFRSGIIYKRA